jgi:hypothetical protein
MSEEYITHIFFLKNKKLLFFLRRKGNKEKKGLKSILLFCRVKQGPLILIRISGDHKSHPFLDYDWIGSMSNAWCGVGDGSTHSIV